MVGLFFKLEFYIYIVPNLTSYRINTKWYHVIVCQNPPEAHKLSRVDVEALVNSDPWVLIPQLCNGLTATLCREEVTKQQTEPSSKQLLPDQQSYIYETRVSMGEDEETWSLSSLNTVIKMVELKFSLWYCYSFTALRILKWRNVYWVWDPSKAVDFIMCTLV